MSFSNLGIMSLYYLSLSEICNTMNESTLQYVLKQLLPKICLDVFWQVSGTSENYHNYADRNQVDAGSEIAQLRLYDIFHITDEKIEEFGITP